MQRMIKIKGMISVEIGTKTETATENEIEIERGEIGTALYGIGKRSQLFQL